MLRQEDETTAAILVSLCQQQAGEPACEPPANETPEIAAPMAVHLDLHHIEKRMERETHKLGEMF